MCQFKDVDTIYGKLFVQKQEDGKYLTATHAIVIHDATMEKCQLTCKEDKCPSKVKSFSNTNDAFKRHYKDHQKDILELGVNSLAYSQHKNLFRKSDTNKSK